MAKDAEATKPSAGSRSDAPVGATATSGGDPDRWRLSWGGWVELPLVAAAVVGLFCMGKWVEEPVKELDGCASVVRFELAVAEAELPDPLPGGVRSIEDLLACESDEVIGEGLRTSTQRDFGFIVAYTAVLVWCGSRMAGRRRLPFIPGLRAIWGFVSGKEHPPSGATERVVSEFDQRVADAKANYRDAKRDLRDQKRREITAAKEGRSTIRAYLGERAGISKEYWVDKWSAWKRRRTDIASARTDELAASHVEDRTLWQRARGWIGRPIRSVGRFLADVFADRIRLPEVGQGERGRQVAGIAIIFVVVAGALDVIENLGLLQTAEHWDGSSDSLDPHVLRVTAGAAAAKFALLALPLIVALLYLVRLPASAFGARARVPRASEVLLPKPDADGGDPRDASSSLPAEHYRWVVPSNGTGGALTPGIANADGTEKRYGISLSGGGVRSATFSLGALQTLEAPFEALDPGPAAAGATPEEQAAHEKRRTSLQAARAWAIEKADYLSAVSGGSYMAASYQFLSQGSRSARHISDGIGATGDQPLLPKAGLVEDHYRRSATHLADGAPEWILAIGEVLVRTLFTVLIVTLTVFAVGIPLGWVYRYVYYGTTDGAPDLSVDMRVLAGPVLALALFWAYRGYARVRDLASSEFGHREQGSAATRSGTVYLLILAVLLPLVAVNVNNLVFTVGSWIGVNEPAPDPSAAAEHLDALIAGTSKAAVGAAEAAAASEALSGDSGSLLPGVQAAAAAAEIAALRAEEAARALEHQARRDTGQVEAAPIDADAELAALVLEVEGLAERLGTTESCPEASFLPPPPTTADELTLLQTARLACLAAQSAAAATQAVVANASVSSAWLSTSTSAPSTTSTTSATATTQAGDTPTTTAPPSPAEGAVALTEAASKAVAGASEAAQATDELADLERTTAEGRPPRFFAGLTALVALFNALYAKRRTEAAANPAPAVGKPKLVDRIAGSLGLGGFSQVLVGLVTALVLVIFLSDVIVFAWSQSITDNPEVFFDLEVWQWWAAILAVLGVVAIFANFNTWSLRPFYHRRLWIPYAATAKGTTADWDTDTKLSVVGQRVPGYPELLVCAAAQTSGRDWAPPGRRALSFVFSANACGGPEVGYVRTSTLEEVLERRRRLRQPVTLFGASTTSGAAFGPAMGRHSKGGIGAAMAIANARLGVWIPNPHHLHELAAAGEGHRVRASSITRWPRVWYWAMEIVGQYPMDARLVQVTDGGHVENLGLVELLRRRCSRILCFDASGAGLTPATLAEAIVLAREELNIEIEILPPLPGSPEELDEAGATAAATVAANAAAAAGAPGGPAQAAAAGAAAVAAGKAAPDLTPHLLDVGASGADPLRRGNAKSEQLAALLSKRPVLVARIHYPEVPGVAKAFTGTLIYGTLALANDGPEDWDLLEYAQRKTDFPKHGTDKQWFEADVFGAYHQLGRRTAERMLRTALAYEEAGEIDW